MFARGYSVLLAVGMRSALTTPCHPQRGRPRGLADTWVCVGPRRPLRWESLDRDFLQCARKTEGPREEATRGSAATEVKDASSGSRERRRHHQANRSAGGTTGGCAATSSTQNRLPHYRGAVVRRRSAAPAKHTTQCPPLGPPSKHASSGPPYKRRVDAVTSPSAPSASRPASAAQCPGSWQGAGAVTSSQWVATPTLSQRRIRGLVIGGGLPALPRACLAR